MSKHSDSDDNNNLEQEIDRIFNETNDLSEIQSKTILLVRDHTKDIGEKDPDKIAAVEKDIANYCREATHDKSQESDSIQQSPDKKTQSQMITEESKKNLKTLLKNFVIYEIYQVMNPKRIAGETEKTNYQHNLITGGEKKADEYAKHDFSDEEKAEMRAAVNKEVASWDKEKPQSKTLSALDLSTRQAAGDSEKEKPKDRTLDALDLATSIRGSLENPRSHSVSVSQSAEAGRGVQLKKQADMSRENKGQSGGKGQGGPGL